MEGFQCILTIKLYLIRIPKKNKGFLRRFRCVGNKLQFIYQQLQDLVTGMEATLVFASPASSSQERRVAIMRRDAEWLQPGPKQSGLLTAYREPSGDMSLSPACEECQLCTSQVISEMSLFLFICQMVSRSLMCTKAKTFLFSKDQNIFKHSQKLVFTCFEYSFLG